MKATSDRLSQTLGSDIADKRIAILRSVGECGSISESARANQVSYKAAWQAIETLSHLAGADLVHRAVGGSGGGGAVLTAAGEDVLRAAQWLQAARRAAFAGLAQRGVNSPMSLGLQLRTSMRNQWTAEVMHLQGRGGMVRVSLCVGGHDQLQASITRESAELLDLREGRQVLALCKATALRVEPFSEHGAIDCQPGTNSWRVQVVRASRAAAGGEVTVESIAATAASEPAAPRWRAVGFAAAGHGLRAKHWAVAHLPESALVLALADT